MAVKESSQAPSPADFERQAAALAGRLHRTPVWAWDTPIKRKLLGEDGGVVFKLELFQRTGSFKARGALTVMDHFTAEEKTRGVVAGSGGNHGIAVAFAAHSAGTSAVITVPRSINPFRLEAIKAYGAKIVQVGDMGEALDEMRRIAQAEGRAIMHPFENPLITLGTGTMGYEFLNQIPDLDILIVPIGGGGLASGCAAAVKQMRPACRVFGVEPKEANSMFLSLQAGKPLALSSPPRSIADSLCSPRAESYSFSLCQKYLDDVVLVDDDEIRAAMRLLFEDMKLAVEPAGATATAGLLYPLKERCRGAKTGILLCGSNIDIGSFMRCLGER